MTESFLRVIGYYRIRSEGKINLLKNVGYSG
ncbi:MAG: hypothetical protein QOF02_1136 [Blastocatellia bacterium]|jgi:hypothetical protein|nr:hypothetical protein [Blastocatellia bacterium]